MPMLPPPMNNPFQLLEINIISAQDLAPVSKTMRTYAVAWVHPERKLATRIDGDGRTNPTWNDKFVFRVNDEFLNADTSAIMIEIFSSNWMKDVRIGTVRVLIGNLFPNLSPTHSHHNDNPGMRFVALQIRRPSGRPQGILNIGVSLLDGTMRSMPLYKDLSSSAVGFHDLMDDKQNSSSMMQTDSKIKLRRTQSEKSDPICIAGAGGSSILNGSVITGSEIGLPTKGSMVSDVGPSASIVAAAIARGLYLPAPAATNGGGGSEVGSLILEDWKMEDASVEGLKTKIGRWKAELPPIYDRGSEQQKSTPATGRNRHARRNTEGGGGGKLFSCFGKAFGCEFTIVCGGGNNAAAQKKRLAGGRVHVSPSDNNNSR